MPGSNFSPSARSPSAPAVVVAGGGIAGLSLSLALKNAAGEGVAVTVCDPALKRDPGGDRRAYAIAAGARRMLETLGIWESIAPGAQPILDMICTDSRLGDPVRPVFLTFGGEVEPGEPFAHMIEGSVLMPALLDACRRADVRLLPQGVSGFGLLDGGVAATLQDGSREDAALLVAADGGRSRLREEAGIGWIAWDYPQSGIVATITHERDHEGQAVEHFLPSGPFAMLPLTPGGRLGHRSSIVWTERRDAVGALLALDPEDQLAEVERRFGLRLGPIALDTPLQAFPLSFGIARRFVASRLALLGDAAHVIHPIAGQGLNLGLRDAAALAEAVIDALRLGLDPGSDTVLEEYERARRFDTVSMGVVTDGLNRLFGTDLLPVRLIRDLGLGLVDRIPALKHLMIREAAGLQTRAPRLMRGEVL